MDKWNVFDDYLSYCGYYDEVGKEDRQVVKDKTQAVRDHVQNYWEKLLQLEL